MAIFSSRQDVRSSDSNDCGKSECVFSDVRRPPDGIPGFMPARELLLRLWADQAEVLGGLSSPRFEDFN